MLDAVLPLEVVEHIALEQRVADIHNVVRQAAYREPYDYKGEIEPIVARRLPAHEIEQGICHAAEHTRRYSSSPQAEFTHEGRRKRGDYVIRQTREKAAKQAV